MARYKPTVGEKNRYRGLTIWTKWDENRGIYYVVIEFAALGGQFKKRSAAKAAIDQYKAIRDAKTTERGFGSIGASIQYLGKEIERIEDSAKGRKRYKVSGFGAMFRSIDAAIAEIERVKIALDRIEHLEQFDDFPMKANLEK